METFRRTSQGGSAGWRVDYSRCGGVAFFDRAIINSCIAMET
jgi:hypothetical protein